MDKFNQMFDRIKQIEINVNKLLDIPGRIEEVEKSNAEMKVELEEIKAENVMLRARIDESEQYSRKRNVIISGIPYEEGEEIKTKIQKFATDIQINLEDYDINAVHRLLNKRGIPPVILCLNSLDKKEKLINWSKINYEKNKKSGKIKNQIFINEHLTKNNEILLKKAKAAENIKYAWFKNGNVLIKRDENSTVEKIISPDQLEEAEDSENEAYSEEEERPGSKGNHKQSSLEKFIKPKTNMDKKTTKEGIQTRSISTAKNKNKNKTK